MSIEILMPKHGLNMAEGHLVEICKNVGDEVKVGDVLFIFETSKAVVEFESRYEGIVQEIKAAEGDDVPVNELVMLLRPLAEAGAAAAPAPPSVEAEEVAPEVRLPAPSASLSQPAAGDYIPATPWVKHLAKEAGLDLRDLVQREGDRIRPEDVEAYRPDLAGPSLYSLPEGQLNETEVPMSRIKIITGERLAASFREVPHIYFSASVDMGAARQLRARMLEENQEKVSYSDLLLAASIKALVQHPGANAHFREGKLYHQHDVNIGFAVATERGLVVPVLHQAQRLSFSEMARRRRILVDKALKGKLDLEEMEGGTFTLTNLGAYGIDSFDPIINIPEVTILPAGSMKDGLVVEGGAIRVAPLLQLRLAGNHRALDGVECAEFLASIKKNLESGNPFWH